MSTGNPHQLQVRSNLLRRLRQFFFDRNFVEVQTPLVAAEIIPELHIDPFQVTPHDKLGATAGLSSSPSPGVTDGLPSSPSPGATAGLPSSALPRPLYLQSSPELHMKRLLCAGAEAIFEVTRSFRAGERGPLHNPEFTIVEWYRIGDDMHTGMQLLDELCQALLETPAAKRTTYAEAFQQQLHICPHTCSIDSLITTAAGANIDLPEGSDQNDRDAWLNLLLATQIEPHLGNDRPEILFEYPASQAALAKVCDRTSDDDTPGPSVAERFELYYRGVELANGYHELTDAAELRMRLEHVNQDRIADGRPALPLPESLLVAMEQGMPDCAGCALGFDRLLMLATGAKTIGEVTIGDVTNLP